MKIKSTLILLTLLISVSLVAQDSFVRSTVIDPPSTYPSGFGATVSGVDLDGDGKLEIYSVDGMTDFMTGDEIPQIIKYERNGTSWDSVWAASFPNERQNTWAALTVGDLDGDGKQEIIWGFTNSFSVIQLLQELLFLKQMAMMCLVLVMVLAILPQTLNGI